MSPFLPRSPRDPSRPSFPLRVPSPSLKWNATTPSRKSSTTSTASTRTARKPYVSPSSPSFLPHRSQHQAETERLKADLARCRKASAEQSDRIDKQKKHTDALDSRLNDLKRAALADQAEIKALKAKLRTAEQDKAQLAGKQADLLELKKAKQDTESKFTNNLRDRDSRIARLENSLAAETTKRESLERQINDLKSKTDADVRGTKQAETQLANVQHELSTARESFAQEREVFITRLENCKALLSHAAEQYASLASSTVPSSTHNKLKRLYHVVEFKVLRLERKLGNAEDQVNELAHLVRQTNHHSDLLETHLADANFQISIYDDLLYSHPPTIKTPPDDVDWNPNQTMNDHDLKASEAHLHELLATYYNLRSQQLVFAFSCIDKDLSIASSLAKQHSQDLANACASNQVITTNLDIAQQEHSSLSDQLCTLKDAHATLQRTCSSLQAQITSLKDQLYQTALDHQAEMKKDKEAVQRHTSAVQKSKMAEDALRAEIDR